MPSPISAVQHFLQDGVRVPGALFVGTPGSDMSGVGDSMHMNQDVDRNIPEYFGIVEAMVACYVVRRWILRVRL